MFDLAWVLAYAGRNVTKTATLSPESVAVFLTAIDIARERWTWTNGADKPTDTEWDTIDALVAQAERDLMSNGLLGTIAPYVTTAPPAGMLECDGASYLRVDYPGLYAALDSAFIVDADNFTVPDIRGRVVLGVGAGAGLSTYAMNDAGGEEAHTLTTSELAVHNHGVTDLGHTHTESAALASVGAAITGVPVPSAVPIPGVTGISGTGISIQNAGSGAAHENRQPFTALRFGIWAR